MRLSNKIKHIYNRVDYAASKKIFGNTAGAKNNLSTSFNGIKSNSKIHNEDIQNLKLKQYHVLGYPYDESLIKKITSKYYDLIEKEEVTYGTGKYEGKSYSIHIQSPHKQIPEIGDLVQGEIRDLIEGYYGGHFKISLIDIFRNLHVPKEITSKKETFSNYWHCDSRDLKYLKLFVLLDDVTEENGPFHVMSQQRTKEIIKKGFGTRENYNVSEKDLEDPEHTLKAIGKTGMAYFANAQTCLHKAGMPSQGHHRDVIQFVFEPSGKPLEDNWIEIFLQDESYGTGANYNKLK